MKNLLLKSSLAVIIIVLAFSSCKKGDNDPAISLKTRKARLSNTWELSNMDYTQTNINSGYTFIQTYSYSSGIQTVITITDGSSSAVTTKYIEEFTFEKDGTFSIKKNYDGSISKMEGNWVWLGKNKEADLKNKEAIAISITETSSDGNVISSSGKSTDIGGPLVIDKLSSKELVFITDKSTIDSNGNSETMKGTVTYTKK